MKILGIDPGYDRLGVAVIEKTSSKDRVLFSDCIQTSPRQDIYKRFATIGAAVEKVIEEYKPDQLAIENLFITKNQKTAMRVAEVRGLIIYEAAKRNIPVYEFTPMQVKMSLTGNGKSDKSQIAKMIGLLVKMPQKKIIDDEFDAIAVALTCSATIHSRH